MELLEMSVLNVFAVYLICI